jgi:hypothetical protein
MIAEVQQRRFAIDPELLTAQEQERRFCTSHPTETAGPCEPKRSIRCDHGDRELYRNHFPTER